jgi:hypothetical protein
MGWVEAPAGQLGRALYRTRALGFNSSKRQSLGRVNFQRHPAAYVIQSLCQSEAVEGAANE